MGLQPLYVTFEGCQVEITTAIPEIYATLKRWFAAMLSARPAQIVKRVEIQFLENAYWMRAGDTVEETIREELWLLQAVKYEVVMGLIAARANFLWFHAGAVVDQRGAVLFAGVGGSGKSTLVSQLCLRGWQYLSDDVIPLDLQSGKILPFPQTPRVRQASAELVPSDRLGEVPKHEIDLSPDQICQNAVPIRAIVFVQHNPNVVAEIKQCSPGNAAIELLRHCMNFSDHKQLAMKTISEVVSQSLNLKLSFWDGETAIDQLKTWIEKN